MFCTKCGSEIPSDARFCGICGQPVVQPSSGEQNPKNVRGEYTGDTYGTPYRPADDHRMILKIFAGVMTVIFLFYLLGSLGNLFSSVRFTIAYLTQISFLPMRAVSLVLSLASTLMFAITTWSFILFLLRWEENYSDSLFGFSAAACVLNIVLKALAVIVGGVNRFLWGYGFGFFFDKSLVVLLVVSVIAVVGLYFVLSSIGCKPNLIMEKGSLGDWLAFSIADAVMLTKEGSKASAGRDAAAGAAAASGAASASSQGAGPLEADRSLLMYILLTIITCGIYSLYFLYKIARDVNIACAGDGEETPGLVKLILLSLITCGIYGWYWYYKLGNRLANNAPRYGRSFEENGTTVLLWMLLGSLICGVGSLIAMHIIIKNTNEICRGYNDYVTAQTNGYHES